MQERDTRSICGIVYATRESEGHCLNDTKYLPNLI
jgi:hypothetical protein